MSDGVSDRAALALIQAFKTPRLDLPAPLLAPLIGQPHFRTLAQDRRLTANQDREDGGRTWRPLAVPGQGPLTTLDAEHAWLLQPLGGRPNGPPAGALCRTSDGGASWQRLAALGVPNAGLRGPLLFVDPEHGLLVVGTLGGGLVSLLGTVDGGVSWQPVTTFGSPVPGPTATASPWPSGTRRHTR